jgi:hypothetical protein
MKSLIAKLFILGVISIVVFPPLALLGCSKGSSQAKDNVEDARILLGGSQELLQDLATLDARFNTLGTRFSKVEDTIAEGKSLADMAVLDVDELETRYSQARDLLNEVIAMDDAGDYAGYSQLALQAVDSKLQQIALNREQLTAVTDMLDVLPMAENQDQLSYYVDKIDELNKGISQQAAQAEDAAAAADSYYGEHNL